MFLLTAQVFDVLARLVVLEMPSNMHLTVLALFVVFNTTNKLLSPCPGDHAHCVFPNFIFFNGEGFKLPCVVAVVSKHRLFRSTLELPMIDGHKDWVLIAYCA